MRNLLFTKLNLPLLAGDVTIRRRLLAQLDRGLDKKLTLICAPAGYGKTTLLTFWLRALLASNARMRVAWYTLDKTDDDLPTFVSYLAAAIRQADPTALANWVDLERRPALPGPEALTAELAQVADALPGRLMIVLDDYHFITDQAIHRLMAHLLRHLPPALHLVITARSDPPLGIPQLRGRNQVSELRAHDLALSLSEAEEFLTGALAAPVAPEVVQALWERTEGWAVGLRLAAISLAASEDHRRFVRNFRQHSSQHIVDYLVDEVLQSQPPAVYDFLLQTSLLDRLSGDLCAAVLGIESHAARAMLADLAHSNLFLVPLDAHGEWYRYHSQFCTMLGNRLRVHASSAEIAALHGRAAAWLGRHDLVAEALPHYLAAGDHDGAARLVERHIPAMLKREQWLELARWLALLPETLIGQRPALLLLRAWVYLFDFRQVQIRSLVEQAEHLLRGEAEQTLDADALWGQVHALRASTAFATGPTTEAIDHAREALRRLPAQYVWPRTYALSYLARWTLSQGDYPAARALIEAEIAAAGPITTEHLVRLHYAWCVLAYLAGSLDDFRAAVTRYEAAARQIDMPAELKWAQCGLAIVHLERNEPAQALPYLEAVVAHPELAHFQTLRLATYALLGLYARDGRAAEARRALAVLRQRLGDNPDPDNLGEVEALEAYWALLNGDLPTALRWARAVTRDAPAEKLAYRGGIQVRILLASGAAADLERATLLAQRQLETYRRMHYVGAQTPALVLLALAYWRRRMTGPALAALREALTLGYPQGRRAVFTQHGALMGEMLSILAREPAYAAMAGSLLAELGRLGQANRPRRQQEADDEQIIEPLTGRETEILALMADGLSNKEIAHRLGISSITVRNHTVNIYGKLHVSSRRQAVDCARQLGFLRAPNTAPTRNGTK